MEIDNITGSCFLFVVIYFANRFLCMTENIKEIKKKIGERDDK